MQNDRVLFSIIMPTFGVERYIATAIESIQAQTCPDWELIVVDDCTPDRSADIARQIGQTDSRIIVVSHPCNKGLSAARNTGLEHARGLYVWFPDPDDRYDPCLLADAKHALDEKRYDVVLFGHVEEYYSLDGSLQYEHPVVLSECRFDSPNALHREVLGLEQNTAFGYAWNKIYRLSEVRRWSLAFRENAPLIEDVLFNFEYFDHASSAALLPTTPYHYAKRTSSNLTNKFEPRYYELHRTRISELLNQQKRWKLDTHERRAIIGSLYGRYALSALERNCDPRSGMNAKNRREWCKQLFNDPLFCELIPVAKATDSRILSFALCVLGSRNVLACTALARLVHIARQSGISLFTKVKSQR